MTAEPSPTTFLLPGRNRLDLLDPDPSDIDIRHIATALANTSALPGPVSEATRSVTAARLALPNSPSTALAALLATAPSVYAGRIPEPFHDHLTTTVPAFRSAWRTMHHNIFLAITRSIDRPAPSLDNIRDAARLILQADRLLAAAPQQARNLPPDAWLRFLENMPANRPRSNAHRYDPPPVPPTRWPAPAPPGSYTSPIRLAHSVSIALAHMPRYHGLHGRYCVAQHSMAVAALLPAKLRLHALLHDAHEAWSGDLATPAQIAIDTLSPGFRQAFSHARAMTDHQLRTALGIRPPTAAEEDAIHRADADALQRELAVFTETNPVGEENTRPTVSERAPWPFPTHGPGRNAWPQPIAANRFHQALLSSLAHT